MLKMFFKHKQHRLPRFPPDLIVMFKGLCIDVPITELPELKEEYASVTARRLEENKNNPVFDRLLALEIQKRCEIFLECYESLATVQRRLVIGAIRYCSAPGDAMSEEFFASGMRDDAKVVNHVLEEIGIENSFIELEE